MKNSRIELNEEKLIPAPLPQPAQLSLSASDNRLNRFLQYSAFAAILFGIKLWLISTYGNATPYWDQWDAEAANLYKPFLNGTLSWHNLFDLHNEHRILTTRLLTIFLFNINHTWNPLLQMVVNAGLHVFLLIIISSFLNIATKRKYLPAILFFSLILFSVPYAWENTLAGFQAQFYFVLLFSVIALWCIITSAPFSLKWWVGIAWSVLAFFSLASGIFAIGSAALISLVFYLTAIRKTNKQLIAVVLLTALFILGFKLTPVLPDHAEYKANSFSQFYNALKGILGWPISKSIISVVICYAPAYVFIKGLIRERPPVTDRRWFLVALVVWSIAQSVSIAYGRAIINLSPRYLDLFAIAILVNFVCLLLIAQNKIEKAPRAISVVAIWVAAVLIPLGIRGGKNISRDLAIKHAHSLIQETNTRNYITTGDIHHLKDKGLYEIPYPIPDRLAMILSWPEIREILPGNINPLPATVIDNPAGTFVAYGYSPITPKRIDSILGSYHNNGQGNVVRGKLSIQFNNNKRRTLQFPVAGYPLNDSMKVEIEQNGQRMPLPIKSNPEESWGTAYANLDNGPFTIRLTDSSTTAWMAIGMPSSAGRLDSLTDFVLSHYYIFITLGLTIVAFLIIQGNLIQHQTKP